MKKIVILLFALATAIAASAQTKFPLTIVCNVMDADVYVNGHLYTKTTPNLNIQLPVGTWQIGVSKAGYQDFKANVAVRVGGTTLQVNLLPLASQAPAPAANPFIPQFTLNITSNVPGANVTLSGKYLGQTPLGLTTYGGSYDLLVQAPGYDDYRQRIQLQGPLTVNATLQPMGSTLSVNSNVPGAQVIINGSAQGQAPFTMTLVPGTYNLIVRAPGYLDYTETFTLNGPRTISANLQGQSYTLQASAANAPGALIFLNGNQVATGSYNATLPPGTYSVVIRAAGFNDYSETFALNAPRSLVVSLQPNLVSFTFTIPDNFYNPEVGSLSQGRQNDDRGKSEGRGNAIGQGRTIAIFELYVDGNLIMPSGNNVWNGAVSPGAHVFKILSGGLRIESSINLQPGKNWLLQPSLGITAQ